VWDVSSVFGFSVIYPGDADSNWRKDYKGSNGCWTASTYLQGCKHNNWRRDVLISTNHVRGSGIPDFSPEIRGLCKRKSILNFYSRESH
jgi:hypothetical protein